MSAGTNIGVRATGTKVDVLSNSTADDEVIGIVHDVRFPTLLVPEFLPPQHEPSHVSGKRLYAGGGSLCLSHNHPRSLLWACISTAL